MANLELSKGEYGKCPHLIPSNGGKQADYGFLGSNLWCFMRSRSGAAFGSCTST